MPEECSEMREPDQPDETFKKLLIPEMFSLILRNLSEKERLSCRLVCRATEKAVAGSDMYVDGYPGMSIIYLEQVYFGLKKLRKTIRLKKEFDSEELAEVVTVRERLFSRLFVKHVHIDYVDFNSVPVPLVARLLSGCIFDEATINIRSIHYNSELIDLIISLGCEKTRLIVHGNLTNKEDLFSLEPMRELQLHSHTSNGHTELMIELVKKRHAFLSLPFAVTSEDTIFEIKKILEEFGGQQCVSIPTDRAPLWKFLLQIGFKMGQILKYKRHMKVHRPSPGTATDASSRNVLLRLRKLSKQNECEADFDVIFEHVKIAVKGSERLVGLRLMFYRNYGEEIDEDSESE